MCSSGLKDKVDYSFLISLSCPYCQTFSLEPINDVKIQVSNKEKSEVFFGIELKCFNCGREIILSERNLEFSKK